MNTETIIGIRNSTYKDNVQNNLLNLLSDEVRQMEDLNVSGIPTIHSFDITEHDNEFIVGLEISNRSKSSKLIKMTMRVTKSQVLSYMYNELDNSIRSVGYSNSN